MWTSSGTHTPPQIIILFFSFKKKKVKNGFACQYRPPYMCDETSSTLPFPRAISLSLSTLTDQIFQILYVLKKYLKIFKTHTHLYVCTSPINKFNMLLYIILKIEHNFVTSPIQNYIPTANI